MNTSRISSGGSKAVGVWGIRVEDVPAETEEGKLEARMCLDKRINLLHWKLD